MRENVTALIDSIDVNVTFKPHHTAGCLSLSTLYGRCVPQSSSTTLAGQYVHISDLCEILKCSICIKMLEKDVVKLH